MLARISSPFSLLRRAEAATIVHVLTKHDDDDDDDNETQTHPEGPRHTDLHLVTMIVEPSAGIKGRDNVAV
jgi:hypothetical protein